MRWLVRRAIARAEETHYRASGEESVNKKFLGLTVRTWLEYLAATVIGNVIYFYSLEPHLPESLQHNSRGLDLGSLVDFLVCVGVYGLIWLGGRL
jgi:hypothetical protein